MNFYDSSIVQDYKAAANDIGYFWDPANTHLIYKCMLEGISRFLGEVKEQTTKVSIVIQTLEGEFRLAGIVGYHAPEEEGQVGNWSYVTTFDEEDIKDTKQYLCNDSYFHRIMARVFFESMHGDFNEMAHIQKLCIIACDLLLKWLDVNADPATAKELTLDGYFKAKVEVEDSLKVFSITPAGEMKTLMKGDAANEVI